MAMWGTGRKDAQEAQDPKDQQEPQDPKPELSITPPETQPVMKERNPVKPPETAISIIGPGMKVVGDCITDGTVRIEGRVEGAVKAGKAVVVGKEGTVEGNIETQDAVISGVVTGTVNAESRLELQSTCRIEGEIYARRMQLEEGAIMNGRIHMGEVRSKKPESSSKADPMIPAAKPTRVPEKAAAS